MKQLGEYGPNASRPKLPVAEAPRFCFERMHTMWVRLGQLKAAIIHADAASYTPIGEHAPMRLSPQRCA